MPTSIRSRPTPWQTILLVCGKCSRKLDGGFGPDHADSLRATLRGALKEQGHGRAVRVIETKCLGVCPKKAVTALNASAPGHILIVPKGTGPRDALAALMSDSARMGDSAGVES